MRLADEAVVGVFTAVHGTHAIKLAHQDGGEQVIDRGGVARMTIQEFLELLDRAVIIHVVEAVEGGLDQRIALLRGGG